MELTTGSPGESNYRPSKEGVRLFLAGPNVGFRVRGPRM